MHWIVHRHLFTTLLYIRYTCFLILFSRVARCGGPFFLFGEMTISSFLKVFLRVSFENWSPMFAFFLLSLRQMIICKRCPNRFLSVILTISGYLNVFCSVRCENISFRDSVIAKLPMFCSSSALASEKHRFLVKFPHFARFTDRSGRSTFCNFVKH